MKEKTKFVCLLGRFEPSTPSIKELHISAVVAVA